MSMDIENLMQHQDVTKKGAKRIVEILQVGVDILLQEGFTSLTKRKIANRLGISHGNVSYYFPTRESLWKAVIGYEFKEYSRRHDSASSLAADDAQGRFDELVGRWFDEYKDREMRIFFSQILAFAEVSEVVARIRDDMYEMDFEATMSLVRQLLANDAGVSDAELEQRVLTIIATLEGLHTVSAFRPEKFRDDDNFREQVIGHMNLIARGAS
jgi:AcrR family transcriptional regulator